MAGWKQWLSGEVVDHTDFQSYLQDQVVQTYAGTAARGSVLGTAVSEGMVAYLEDTNLLTIYTGSSWVEVPNANGTVAYATLAGTAVSISGTITSGQVSGTAVTRGDTGTVTNTMLAGSIANNKLTNSSITLNGSAVSLGGSLTISGTGFSNPMTTLGDLIVGGTAGAAQRLGIGTNGQYLFTNGTASSWATITTLGAVTTSNTATSGTALRNITMSTATPTGGADGDVWLQYTP